MTINEIKGYVRELESELHGNTKAFKAYVCLLAATEVGTGIGAISKFTGYNRKTVKKFHGHLVKNGIFKNGKIYHSGWFDEDGIIALALDVNVAIGYVKRVS